MSMKHKKKFPALSFSQESMAHIMERLQKAQLLFQPTTNAIKSAHKSLQSASQPIKKAQEAISGQLKAVAEVLSDAVAPLHKFVEEHPAYLEWLSAKHDEVEQKSKETFKALKREFVFFMAQNGYILPDEEQFFNWYFFVKYLSAPPTKQALEEMTTVTPEDLEEYQDYVRRVEEEGRGEEAIGKGSTKD